MRFACIDIGSNTTRLLVAEPDGAGGLRDVCQQRAYTRLGRGRTADGSLARERMADVAHVVATQRAMADQLGAEVLRVVATAAVRSAPNREELAECVRVQACVDVAVLSGEQEAELAFAGATRSLPADAAGTVAVVDVGGGSSEVACGSPAGGVAWCCSLPVGSSTLTEAHLRSDPPSAAELHALRQHAAGAFEGLELPRAERAVAVGGSATSLRRLVGALLEHEALERGVRLLASRPAEAIAEQFSLDPERVRLLPAGIVLLDEITQRLGLPLRVGGGGLREGVILRELAAATMGPMTESTP